MRESLGTWIGVGLVASAAMAAIGCGSADDPIDRVSGAPMLQKTDTAPVAIVASATEGMAPRIEAIRFEPAEAFQGQKIRALPQVSASDDRGLTLDFTWTVGGERLASRGPEVTLYRANKGDEIEVTLIANHRGAKSAPYTATTWVGNQPPRVSRVQLEPASNIEVGRKITALPRAKDPDGDPVTLSYRWTVNGRRSAERSATLQTDGLQRGDSIQLEVVASDGDAESEPFKAEEITLVNAAPRIVSQPGGPGDDGVFRYRVVAEDPDGDPVARYSLAQAPEGMTIVAAYGQIEWLPTQDQRGQYTVEVVVEDLEGAKSSQRFEMVVGAPPAEGAADSSPAAPAY